MLRTTLAVFEVLLKMIFDAFHKALMTIFLIALLVACLAMTSVILGYSIATR